jgi:hypothetical protein
MIHFSSPAVKSSGRSSSAIRYDMQGRSAQL